MPRTTKRDVDKAKALAESAEAYVNHLISEREKSDLRFLKEIALAKKESEHLNQQYVLELYAFRRGD